MKIEVRLFATLREGRAKVLKQEVPEGTTVFTVVDSLKIPRQDVSILLVNGRHGSFERIFQEGDILSLFPPVGGG
jgi:sulfur carrier protein